MLSGALTAPTALAAQSSTTPTLIVEVVLDPSYDVIPGATVTVFLRANHKQQYTATTDEAGLARFVIPRGDEYEIEAKAIGFKKGRVKRVSLGYGLITEVRRDQRLAEGKVRQGPPPRIQIRLTAGAATTVF